jgi:hypothetical protein
MGIKDAMMERMIDKMSKEEKQEMMEKMMDKFFSSMTKEEKKEMMNTMMPKMMDNMFKDMSAQDKQELMMGMMPQMMSMMFGGGGEGRSPMAGMMAGMMGAAAEPAKSGAKKKNGKKKADAPEAPMMPPMMKMMEGCCGGEGDGDFKPPWISMENAFDRAMIATEHSLLATKEIQKLFKDWVKTKNKELLTLSQDTTDLKQLADKMQISKSSLYFLLCKLAQDDKINLKITN